MARYLDMSESETTLELESDKGSRPPKLKRSISLWNFWQLKSQNANQEVLG